MLFHSLTQEAVVAIAGSGCSAALGYPTWKELAAELAGRTIDALRHNVDAEAETLAQLARFKERLELPARVGSEELMFFVGVCKAALSDLPDEENPYRSYFRERFGPADRDSHLEHNPYLALLDLPIYRLVTTNYDCEIERALELKRRVTWEDFGIETGVAPAPRHPLSFTQRPEHSDQLARFALARDPETRNMVFHCHGRFDDVDSIIATEADYQEYYLAGEGEYSSAFLQTSDLLFNSNPILFVGYGLGDEDLLRPLRRLRAVAQERKHARPVFALMPEASDGDDWAYHERLFERFGLHVLPFVAPSSADPQDRARALCDELTRLEEDRKQWRDLWFEKPTIRPVSVRVRPREPYRHYVLSPKEPDTLGAQRTSEELDDLARLAIGGAKVIGLVGPGGTGKSWHAMRLLDRFERERGTFQGFFFWSSYYADDFVTGLDRLLAYIDPRRRHGESRFTRLRGCLSQGRYLLVLDGLERLLGPTGDPEVGASNDPIVRGSLEILSGDSLCTVVITSRLWPKDLDPDAPGIERHSLDRMRTGDLVGVVPFSWLDRDRVSELCSLLGGHTYALLLAGSLLRQGPPDEAAERWLELRRVLAETTRDRRLASVIRRAVEALNQRTGGLALALLERLAVFMSPVAGETLHRCFALAREATSGDSMASPALEEVVGLLRSWHLLFEVTSGPSELDRVAYTVHPTVRSYVFQQAHRIERDVLPNFTLAGFTSGQAAVHPGSPETTRLVRDLFARLHGEAIEALAHGRRTEASQLCRSLFSIVRSRMETNTAPGWTRYDDYIGFGLKIADLAKRVAPRLWSFRERHELGEIEDPAAPLYADELAFVYNDVGLTLCAEGFMEDTLAVWEQGYEINQVLEGLAEVPLYSLQSQLHLGHTFLELGDLETASQYLEETARTNYSVRDPDYGARILGYQGLIGHHRNQLDEAEKHYRRALRQLQKAGGNPRAESYFFSHRAKLAMVIGRFDRAERYVRSSWVQAEAGGARDLVAYARTARARWCREQDRLAEANGEYQAALVEARRLGIRRLEAEILTGLARVALKLGDAGLARRRAYGALAIANELGLGLRKTQALIVLGLATVAAGQPKLGIAYLELGKNLGDRQQYWLRSREADKKLQELGEPEETG